MRNLRLDLCYDGTRYRGWQRLPGKEETIQGKLESALTEFWESLLKSAAAPHRCGVHALRQTANFHCESDMAAEEILENLRRYLPEDIGIYSCKDASARFHARLNAKEKTYLYRIWNSEEPCVFSRRYVAVMPEKLDLKAMERGGALLCGEHDFSAFCGNAKMKKSTVRYLRAVQIRREGPEVQLRFTGNGFLQNMVRILVGTLVEVGRGERAAEDLPELFSAKRIDIRILAPAKGLCLEEVVY